MGKKTHGRTSQGPGRMKRHSDHKSKSGKVTLTQKKAGLYPWRIFEEGSRNNVAGKGM